jgi:hypothetical protein
MLMHGLPSPHSKLLPEANTQQPSSQPLLGWASGEYNECWIQYVILIPPLIHPLHVPNLNLNCVPDTSATMTKSGLFKDQWDTPQRHLRHQNGLAA